MEVAIGTVLSNNDTFSKSAFLCLDVTDLHQTDCDSRQLIAASTKELQAHCKTKNKRLFINVGTLEIYCFACNLEILDENVKDLTVKVKPIHALKSIVKTALKSSILKTFSSTS